MNNEIFEIVFFVIVILTAGFFKSIETAISSIGENKINELNNLQVKAASFFKQIQKKPENFFGSLRILYTTFNVAAALSGAYLLIRFSKINPEAIINLNFQLIHYVQIFFIIIIITSIIIVFTLLIPGAVGIKFSVGLSVKSVRALWYLSILMKYPVKILTIISNMLLLPVKEKTRFTYSRPSEDEILDMISDGVKSGAIDENEQEIIENILEFTDLKANEVMIPRTEMVSVDVTAKNDMVVQEIIHSGHSLLPAYEETPDNIIGVIHTKDLMKQSISGKPVLVKKLVRPAYFIPETKPISEVLKEMQQIGERLVIVTDEYGGTEGIITLEDVIEEIVGEIKDKTKVDVNEFSELADGSFCILGSMDIDDFNETFSHHLPESEEYNTVAGFILERTGKILNQGESFAFEGIHFELIKKNRQKMVQFKVYSDYDDFKTVAE